MAERDFKGVWIPRDLWLNKSLTLQEKAFLVEIDSLDNKDGCFATNAHFANLFGISTRRVSEVISGLVSKGIVSSVIVQDPQSGKSAKRILHIEENFMGIEEKFIPPHEETFHTPHEEKFQRSNTSINNTSINNTPLTPHGGNDSGFNVFWKAYPRKVAKANALKAWLKLKPDADLLKTITTALEQHKKSEQWQRENGQFIPHPATWLNARRWEDEMQSTEQAQAAPKPRKGHLVKIINDYGREEEVWRED